jgi:hypothetical protein
MPTQEGMPFQVSVACRKPICARVVGVCVLDSLCRCCLRRSRTYYFVDQEAYECNETVNKVSVTPYRCKSNACRRRPTLSQARVSYLHTFTRSTNDADLVESFLGEHTRYLVLLAGFSVGLSIVILLCYLSQQRDWAYACFGMSCDSFVVC